MVRNCVALVLCSVLPGKFCLLCVLYFVFICILCCIAWHWEQLSSRGLGVVEQLEMLYFKSVVINFASKVSCQKDANHCRTWSFCKRCQRPCELGAG